MSDYPRTKDWDVVPFFSPPPGSPGAPVTLTNADLEVLATYRAEVLWIAEQLGQRPGESRVEMVARVVVALAGIAKLHRRTQAAESEAAAAPRRFEGAIREATRRFARAQWVQDLYRRRNRALHGLLKIAGVPDAVAREVSRAADCRSHTCDRCGRTDEVVVCGSCASIVVRANALDEARRAVARRVHLVAGLGGLDTRIVEDCLAAIDELRGAT